MKRPAADSRRGASRVSSECAYARAYALPYMGRRCGKSNPGSLLGATSTVLVQPELRHRAGATFTVTCTPKIGSPAVGLPSFEYGRKNETVLPARVTSSAPAVAGIGVPA